MNDVSFASADVSVHWRGEGGASIGPDSRIEKLDYGTRLQISDLRRSDEGNYACIGQIKNVGSTEFPIQLLVHGQTSRICCYFGISIV